MVLENIEKEVKVLNIRDDIEDLLISKGCRLCKHERQLNIIFKGSGIAVKLRHTVSLIDDNEKFEMIRKLSVKGRHNKKYKVKKEKTANMTRENFDNAINLMRFMGLKEILNGRKLRKSYQLNGFLYEIDEWEKHIYPEPYLEVEAMSPNLDIKKGLKQIWTSEEVRQLVLSNESIVDLKERYESGKHVILVNS